ncbi:DMT family transporter [uncultured Jatrophihabitans sp.]|uniref:EamA family transporter n=1 Tax=uncultured Jatrophihabitans sp. TaxID=1610747 RepID=UPI0035C9CD67
MPSTNAAGLGLAIASAATFGTSGTFASGLLAAGWTPGAAVTIRVGVAALLLTIPAVLTMRGRWHLLRRSLGAVAAYGLVAIAGCQLFYFNAVERLSVGVALLLEYCGTLLVVVWLWVRHHQRPSARTGVGGVIALAGLCCVLDLTGGAHLDPVGVLWGLAAAAGLATYFMLSARADDPLPPLVTVWGGMCVGSVALLLLGVVGAIPMRASTAAADFADTRVAWWLPVLGLAFVAAALAYTLGIAAAQRLGARLASFVGLAEVLFAVLCAWLLLGERPGVVQGIGGVVMLAGIALVRAGERVGADEQVVAAPAATEPVPQ